MHAELRGRCGIAALSLALAMSLSACGGGGGGSETPSPTVIPESLSITGPGNAEVAGATQFGNSAAALTGLKYSWDFGDGGSSTEASPSHSYARGGDYEVLLKVSNEAGVSRETRFKLTVNNLAQMRGLVCSGEKDSSGWCWQQPLPTGSERRDVFFIDAKIGWMVGANGEIFKTSDAGGSWLRQSSGIDTPLNIVRFSDANQGWAMGDYGALLRTTDGGASWQLSKVEELNYYGSAVAVADARVLMLHDGYGGLRISEDGGLTWRHLAASLFQVGKDKVIWYVNQGRVYKSTDLGVSSSAVLDLNVANGWPSASYELIAMDEQRLIVKRYLQVYENGSYRQTLDWWVSRDGGSTWTQPAMRGLPTNLVNVGVRLVHGGPDEGLLMVVGSSALYRSSNGGESWSSVALLTNSSYINASSFYQLGDRVLMYVDYNEFFLSQDGGASWKTMAKPGSGSSYNYPGISRASAPAPGTFLVSMGDGASYLSADSGASWRQIAGLSNVQRQEAFRAFAAIDAKRALAINGKGELMESKDGGRSWQLKQSGLYNYGSPRLSFASPKVGWMSLGDGRLYRTTDGGDTWSAGLGTSFNLGQFQFIDEMQGWASSNGRLLQSLDGGLGWIDVGALPANTYLVRFQSASHGLATSSSGIFETRDGGKTWTPRFTGASATVTNIVFADAKNVWALAAYGELLQSSDGGETWRRANLAAPNMSGASIQFLDANRGWIAGSNGTVFATLDGGKNWQRQNTGTNQGVQQIQFVDAKTGWLLGANGELLTTGTGGY